MSDLFTEHNARATARRAELEMLTKETERLEERFVSFNASPGAAASPMALYKPTAADVLLCHMHKNALLIAAAKEAGNVYGSMAHAYHICLLWFRIQRCILRMEGLTAAEAHSRAFKEAHTLDLTIRKTAERNNKARQAAEDAAALPGQINRMRSEDRRRYGV